MLRSLSRHVTGRALTRRSVLATGAAAAGALALPATMRATRQATPATQSVDDLIAITQGVMDDLDLRATILQVTIDSDVLVSTALGDDPAIAARARRWSAAAARGSPTPYPSLRRVPPSSLPTDRAQSWGGYQMHALFVRHALMDRLDRD